MKKFFIGLFLSIFGFMGIYTMTVMAKIPRTYDGDKTKVFDLVKNPEQYDTKDVQGVTDVIVKKNLSETHALNAVTAVTFDFRGYDTLGESFILLTAISGSVAILKKNKNRGETSVEEKH